jgi:hypothetical protein
MKTYCIGYAYPTSNQAAKCGYPISGCWTLEIGRKVTGYATRAEAFEAASKTGLLAGRWSMDHPANAKLAA